MSTLVFSQYHGNTIIGVSPGKRSFGVPPGGPLNPWIVEEAKELLGHENCAVIEIIAPIHVEAQQNIRVASVRLNREFGVVLLSLDSGKHTFTPPSSGVGYLALISETPRPFQSISLTSVELEVPESPAISPLRADYSNYLDNTPTLRVIWNTDFQPATGKIESISRVGARVSVEGAPKLESPRRSLPTVPGAIQLSPSGELLIHGPDGPVTGGYPIIGGVISADLHKFSLWNPNLAIRFQPVSREEAVEAHANLLKSHQARLKKLEIARRIHLGDTR
ncbi:MAG: hypothetical protein KDC26_10905 [Armatimonadetes bacterium]|nr:hypothetical protein [Armatimonadota bacterium]